MYFVGEYMSKNYEIKMDSILGDFYLCLGAFNNCVELYNKRDVFKINDTDTEEVKKIKQAQISDLMSNLGKVGEKALKYIIALQKVQIAPNEDLKSLEAVYRGDNAMKYFAGQLGMNIEDSNIQEIFNYKDYNNQKSHNFDYLFLIIEKLMPEQYNKFKNYVLYVIQSELIKSAIINGEIDATFNFVRAIIFPKFSIEAGFTNDEEDVLPNNRKMNKHEYETYRRIIKQSGDIFTRLRYYSNDPKDKVFNLDDIFSIINYFVQYIIIIHKNGDKLDFDLDKYFAMLQSLDNSSLLYLSKEDIVKILDLDVDFKVVENLLFQEKIYIELGNEPYTYDKVKKLMKLNLDSDSIVKIIGLNLAPRFVEFCLTNGIENVYYMADLYEQYIDGKDIQTLLKKRKK